MNLVSTRWCFSNVNVHRHRLDPGEDRIQQVWLGPEILHLTNSQGMLLACVVSGNKGPVRCSNRPPTLWK